MSSFSNLAMSTDLAKDERLNKSKSLFGLFTKVVYVPTQSRIIAEKRELSAEKGSIMERALNAPADKRIDAIVKVGKLSDATLGQFLLEVCRSVDGKYLSLRLYRFMQMRYEAVSDICSFEGADAERLVAAIA